MLINFTQKAIQELEIKKLLLDRAAPEVNEESDEHTWYCTDLELYTDASAILVVHKLTWFSFSIICKNYKIAHVEDLIRDSLLKTLMGYEVPAPPLTLQNQFAAIVEKVEALKAKYQQSLAELENLYGSLSQRAFKGELDLSGVRV